MDEWLTTAEAAKIIKLSPQTLRKWRTQGKGPQFAQNDDGLIRYKRAEIDAYIAGANGKTDA